MTQQTNTNERLTQFLQELNELGQRPECQGVGRWTGSPTHQLSQYLQEPERLEWLLGYITKSGDGEFPLDGAQVRLYSRCARDGQIRLQVGGIDRDRYPGFYKPANELIATHGYARR